MRSIDPDQVRLAVGRRVAELRLGKGLTQEKLAERLRIGVRVLQDVEQGRRNLTLGTMVNLANALAVGVRDLLDPPKSMEVRPGRPVVRTRRSKG